MATRTPKKPTPFIYRGTHDLIIKEAIKPLYLLDAKQVTRLLYPSEKLGMYTTVKDRLSQLTREKYLVSYTLPTAEGQRPQVFALGLQGQRLLEREGYDPLVHRKLSELKDKSYAWQYHLLELNNVFITAMIIEKYIPTLTLFDFQHDYIIKKNPALALDETGRPIQIEPDGFLDICSNLQRHAYFLLELDRYSHSNDTFRRKFRNTIICHQQEKLTTHFNVRRLTILYITTKGEKRVEQMRHLARLELKSLNLSSDTYEAQMFKFASIPPFGEKQPDPITLFCSPCWLSAYGDPEKKETLIELEKEMSIVES